MSEKEPPDEPTNLPRGIDECDVSLLMVEPGSGKTMHALQKLTGQTDEVRIPSNQASPMNRDRSSAAAAFTFRPSSGRFGNAGGAQSTRESPVISKHLCKRLPHGSIDVHEIVRSVVEECQFAIAAAQVEVLLDLGAVLHTVRADRARLQQVMRSMLRNAAEYSAAGSLICITSATDTIGRLTLRLSNQSRGPQTQRPLRVFESSHEGERPHCAGRFRSSLVIARRIAKALGGMLITAPSDEDGICGTFLLILTKPMLPDAVPAINLPVLPGAAWSPS